MPLTLLQAETTARALTRHDNDARIGQVLWRVWANEEYRRMRTWLRGEEVAPTFALLTSANLPVAEGGTVTLSSISPTLEGVHLVEWDVGQGRFRPMERADALDRNRHKSGQFTFREQAGVLAFGPDGQFAGTVRVHYHNTPAALTTDSDPVTGTFAIPPECEMPLTLRTCGWIAVRDGEGMAGRKGWEDAAQALLDEALPALQKRHGIHPRRAGLHVVMGY